MTASSGETSVVSLPVVVMELAAAEPSATPVSWDNPVSSAVSPSSSWQPVPTPPNTTKASTIMTIILPVSHTHLRAHETDSHLVCRLLLEKKKKSSTNSTTT